MLNAAGAERVWHDADDPQDTGYSAHATAGSSAGSTGLVRLDTHSESAEVTPEVLDARTPEEKIVHAARTGALLALTVEPYLTRQAETELLGRFPHDLVSLERLMLRAMRAEAEARRVQWPKVLSADAAGRDSRDFQNLLRLASRAAPRVRDDILALRLPALLTRPGLLACYDLMPMLEAMAAASGAQGGPPSLFLLIPQATPGLPRIDGAVLPVISAATGRG